MRKLSFVVFYTAAFVVLAPALVACTGPQMACNTPVCLVAHWPMNETSGTSVADVVANPIFNVGTAIPGPIASFPGTGGPWTVTGHSNGALYFPGNGNGYVKVASTPDLNTVSHFEAWVAPVQCGAGVYYPILDKWDAVTQNGYTLYLEGVGPGQVRAVLRIGANTFISNATFPANFNPSTSAGTWTHVAVTLDGPYSSFKVNGSPAGTFTAPSGTINNSVELWIGALQTAPTGLNHCEIAVDEVKIGKLNSTSSQQ